MYLSEGGIPFGVSANYFGFLYSLFSIPIEPLILQSFRLVSEFKFRVLLRSVTKFKPGDSLWSIAQRRNLPLDSIILVNPGLDPSRLFVGQTIRVPLRITWRLINGKQDYDHSTMMDDIRRLQLVYPFIQVPSIGNSVLGRDIPEILIGTGNKRVHYNGSFHANEWITTPIVMTFLNDYLLSLTNQNAIRGLLTFPLYQQTTLSIVPMVNPDGVNLVINGPSTASEPWRSRVIEWNNGSLDFSGWKANIRGVDLNDQFPAQWELERERNPKTPGPRDYGGESPLSEPEAIAMADMTRSRDFARVLSFSYSGRSDLLGV